MVKCELPNMVTLSNSRNNPYPPSGWSSEIPRGRGEVGHKSQNVKLNWNFQMGGLVGGGLMDVLRAIYRV